MPPELIRMARPLGIFLEAPPQRAQFSGLAAFRLTTATSSQEDG